MTEQLELSDKDRLGLELFESVLRHYYKWGALVYDEGVYTLTVGGMEFHYLDVLSGVQVLDLRERLSVQALYLEGMNVTRADEVLHFIRPAVSAKVYAQSGLAKLYLYQQGREVYDGARRSTDALVPLRPTG